MLCHSTTLHPVCLDITLLGTCLMFPKWSTKSSLRYLSGQMLGAVLKTLAGKSASHLRVLGFKSQLCSTPASCWCTLCEAADKGSNSHLSGRPELSSQYLALAWLSPGYIEQETASSLCLCLSNKQKQVNFLKHLFIRITCMALYKYLVFLLATWL